MTIPRISQFMSFLLFAFLYFNDVALAQKKEPANYDTKKTFMIQLLPYLNSPEIPLNTQKKIKKIVRIIQQFPNIRLHIEVHDSGFDFVKDKKISKNESQSRSEDLAKNVQDFLESLGVSENKITAVGKGAGSPFVFNQKDPKNSFVLQESKYSYQKNARILLQLTPENVDDNINLELVLESEKIPYWF